MLGTPRCSLGAPPGGGPTPRGKGCFIAFISETSVWTSEQGQHLGTRAAALLGERAQRWGGGKESRTDTASRAGPAPAPAPFPPELVGGEGFPGEIKETSHPWGPRLLEASGHVRLERTSLPLRRFSPVPQDPRPVPSGRTTLHPHRGYLSPLLWVSMSPRGSVRHKLMTQSCSPVSFRACELLWEGPCLRHLRVSVTARGASASPPPTSLPLRTPICHGSFEGDAFSLPPGPPSAALKIFLRVCFSTVG